MIYPEIETLIDTGFAFEQVAVQAARLVANFGDGYTAAARIGDTRGLKAYAVRVQALPDLAQYLVEQETRARYLWNFWIRHKLEKDCEVFRMRDPWPRSEAEPWIFARFAEDELDFGMFSEKVFSTGLKIVEARLQYQNPNDYNAQQI